MKKFGPIVVSQAEDGQRLDKWLKSHYSNITKVMIEKLCRTGQLRINSARVRPNTRVLETQKIRVPDFIRYNDPKVHHQPAKIPIKLITELREAIIFDDKYFIMFNKPSGMAVQGGSRLGNYHLASALSEFGLPNNPSPRLVHRLDKDTSGVIIVARTPKSAGMISHLIKEREISKVYWALVHKFPPNAKGILLNPTMAESSSGNNFPEVLKGNQEYKSFKLHVLGIEEKEAISAYKVLGQFKEEVSWLELMAITGRKHQLRKHLSCIGCPIIGDKRYGGKTKEFTLGNRAKDFKDKNDKLQLHARSIEFQHPFTGENIKIKADPPAHMDKKLQFFDTGNFE